MPNAALVGKAGEVMVAGELLRQHIGVAYPVYDGGVDLIAYQESNFGRVVPIQVKTRSGTGYNFQRAWFRIPGIILVHVWRATTTPEFYIFESISQVEEALGEQHTATESWQGRGVYSVTTPTEEQIARMQPHRNQWQRIIGRLSAN